MQTLSRRLRVAAFSLERGTELKRDGFILRHRPELQEVIAVKDAVLFYPDLQVKGSVSDELLRGFHFGELIWP